jgi:hypothetical protein
MDADTNLSISVQDSGRDSFQPYPYEVASPRSFVYRAVEPARACTQAAPHPTRKEYPRLCFAILVDTDSGHP